MPDPFADLRLPLTPITPRRAFAEALRRRLEAAIHGTGPGGPDDAGADPAAQPAGAPAGATRMVPSLVVHDARAAIRFYVEGMGAVETYRYEDGDRIGHAELVFGDGVQIDIADPYPEHGFVPPERTSTVSMSLTLTVPDPDAAMARALAHGATLERPVEDQFYGARSGSFRDPFGYYWSVRRPIPGAEPPPNSLDEAPSS